jgi:F-type H+-transporting ATPase subunit epsilon
MRLKVLLPTEILLDRDGVDKISAEAENGSFTLLPRHIDYVTVLTAGLLSFTAGGRESFIAVDHGILVKVGAAVTVAARNAVKGGELGELEATIERQFAAADENERRARAAFEKLEAGFIRNLVELKY